MSKQILVVEDTENNRRILNDLLTKAGFDVIEAMKASERLRDINRSGVAVLLVEQDVMNALELADRAYVIDRGRVTKSGASKSLAGDPVIREAYMGIA